WSVPPGGLRTVPFLVMWGPTPDGPKVEVFSDSISTSGTATEFFGRLDGPIGRSSGTSQLGEVRGYRVVGYAGWQGARAGEGKMGGVLGALEVVLDTRKDGGVVGVKPFATADEAKHWAYGLLVDPDP